MSQGSKEPESQRDKSGKGYHKLIVWQKAETFLILIYKYSEKFPKTEEFGLRSQIRRASVSIILNIVEGHRRRSTKEFLRFLNIAESSLTEVEACLEIVTRLDYLSDEEYSLIEGKRLELAIMLGSLVKSLKNKL